jgi:hypothetical protein
MIMNGTSFTTFIDQSGREERRGRKSKRYQFYAGRRRAEERNRALHPWLEEHGGKNESR